MDPEAGQPATRPVVGTPAEEAPTAPSVSSPIIKPESSSLHHSSDAQDAIKGPTQTAPESVFRFESPLLFGQKHVPFSQPHHSQDLIGRYRVSATAAKVARTDPRTGEKINKLRSSYQNHIKSFQIAGRNKPVKHEDSQHGMSLREIAAWPEEEWRNQKLAGKEVSKGLSAEALSKLEKAVKLEPGPVPRNDEWESVLGHEKSKIAMANNDTEIKGGQDRRLGKANSHLNGSTHASGDSDAIRARRTGKRRRYDDDSFEGYGEGFVDDDRDDVDGYSSDGGAKKRKRRKDPTAPNSSSNLGYGMGVQQAIGRGIGAYGGR